MLADGVGAALAAANEVEYGAERGTRWSETLSHMLTGGPYVRSLFLARVGAPMADQEDPAERVIPAARVRILIADDHELIRCGLISALAQRPGRHPRTAHFDAEDSRFDRAPCI